MNGIDLANFFSYIPRAEIVEPKKEILHFPYAFDMIQKSYQYASGKVASIRNEAKIEKEGKLYNVSCLKPIFSQ